MINLLTLTAVGVVALTEGIKFLYGQDGEALERPRERSNDELRQTADASATSDGGHLWTTHHLNWKLSPAGPIVAGEVNVDEVLATWLADAQRESSVVPSPGRLQRSM